MDDLAAWLTAQLDAVERAASAATPGPWRHDPTKHHRMPGTVMFSEAVFAGAAGDDATCIAETGESDDPQSMRDAEHIALHDPARVLAEVKAKRLMLAEILPKLKWADDVSDSEYGDRTDSAGDFLRLLALPFADRDGYLPEWAPDE